jgi:GntR family transcriptional regulator
VAESPNYRFIADRIRAKIASGDLAAGAQLPTEPELQKEYGAARNTVREAIRWLATQGLVEAFAGRGTFVRQPPVPFVITLSEDPDTGFGGGEGVAYLREVEAQGRVPSVSPPMVEIQQVRPEIGRALRLAAGAFVISRHQELFIDERPWSMQTSFYPRELARRGASRLEDPVGVEEGTVRYLEQELGIRQVGYIDRLRIRAVNTDEERFFALRAGSQWSVLENRRIAYDSEGAPFRLTVTVFHPDHAEIAVIAGTVPESARPKHSPASD